MKTKAPEPETMSGIYEDLLGDLGEALAWAKGEQELKTTTLTREAVTEGHPYSDVLVGLEPDVAAVFTDAAAVNEALRQFIKLTKANENTQVNADAVRPLLSGKI